MTQSAAKRPRRLGLIIPWALFALIALGWTGYWFTLRFQAAASIEAELDRQRAAGAKISHGAVSASGYPLRLTLRYDAPNYEGPNGGWAARAASLDVHFNPSNLSLVILEPRGPIHWRNDDITRVLEPRVSAVSLRTKDGAFAELRASAEDLKVAREGGPPGMIKKVVLGVRPDPRRASDVQASLDIEALTLEREPSGFEGLGKTIDVISARVVIENAVSGASKSPVESWRRAGGAARVESIGLNWGPAKLTGDGRMAVDAGKRPAGKLDLKLETSGPSAGMNAVLQGVFAASAQVARGTGQPTPITLRFEEGVMMLGDLPLRPMDPLE